MRVLWLVLARAGSRGLPDKSIRPLGGHPLLAWRIGAARQVAAAEDVWLSTDSEQYAEIGRRYGATVPFLRPAALAADTTASVDVVLHAMDQASTAYDAVGVLQPTSPFVRPQTLTAGAQALGDDPDAAALVATRTARPSALYVQPDTRYLDTLAARLAEGGVLRRQDEPRDVVPSGALYLARWDALRRERSFYTATTLNFRVDGDEAVDIDDADDLAWAEHLVARGRVRPADVGLTQPADVGS
jgi:CMP-N-acetylneuraminic acid synthetase